MLSLLLQTGGRPFAYDDIDVLQNLALAGTRLFAGLPNCVVSGCELTAVGSNYDVNSGVIWLDGELRDFPGRSGVTLPALFQVAAEVRSDNRVHTLSYLNKPCLREQNAELVDYDPLNPPSRRPLMLTANGPLMWWHRVEEKQRRVGELQPLAAVGYVAAEYDADGRGVGAAWGWALANGNSSTGAENLGGRFVVGFDPTRADYDTVGKPGGAESVTLTIAQMPAHTHPYTDRYTVERRAIDSGSDMRRDDDRTENKTTGSTGGNQAHENRPPFVTVLWRMWVGYTS